MRISWAWTLVYLELIQVTRFMMRYTRTQIAMGASSSPGSMAFSVTFGSALLSAFLSALLFSTLPLLSLSPIIVILAAKTPLFTDVAKAAATPVVLGVD